ncbi:zinc ribbon domain-containing protein [Clostridium sporogenes]|nr:zinc ribbon domain-containing protein [Clostridium sporogenes]NFG68100.1 zinc ribbon domain-containing protein [Clostridium sporogenes]
MEMGVNKLICPKCSNNIDDDSSFCSFCGSTIKKDAEVKVSKDINNKTNNSNTNGGLFFVLGVIIAIVGCVLFFISAQQISEAAERMIEIRSVSGDSVAEAYYQEVGKALKGFAMFCRALGVSILTIPMVSVLKHRNN